MDNKAKEARREYKREWQRKNRDKCRAQQERYWTKRAEQAAQQPQPQGDSTPQTMPAY